MLLLNATERADSVAGAAARRTLMHTLSLASVKNAYVVDEGRYEDEATFEPESAAVVRARLRASEAEWAAEEAEAARKKRVSAALALVHRAKRCRAAAPSFELAIQARMRRTAPFYGAIVASKQQRAPWRGMVRVVWCDEGRQRGSARTCTLAVSNILCSAELQCP